MAEEPFLMVNLRNRNRDVVRIRCRGKPAANMRELAIALEEKSGGIVIHRSGSSILLFKGPLETSECF